MDDVISRCVTLLIAMMTVSATANASCGDRPGTPTKLSALPQNGTIIKLQWTNTANESGIYWDVEMMRNGTVFRSFTGFKADFGGQPFGLRGRIDRTLVRRLEYGPTYCFRVRARTGRGSSGCVSAGWSQVECTKTIAPSLFGRRKSG